MDDELEHEWEAFGSWHPMYRMQFQPDVDCPGLPPWHPMDYRDYWDAQRDSTTTSGWGLSDVW